MNLLNLLETWKTVFGNIHYALLAGLIALGFYLFNVLIFIFKTLIAIYPSFGLGKTLQFFIIAAIGFRSVIMTHSFIGLIVTSILLGALCALVIYKIRMGLQDVRTK